VAVTLADALHFHDRGWAVIPIRAGTKKAAIKWGKYQRHRPDEAQLRRWFGNDDCAGLAVITGEVSGGLVCRDYDDLTAYQRWAEQNPVLAGNLPTVATPRPGRHIYAVADVDLVKAASRSGDGAIIHLGDGELRAGGYCLLPPSAHPTGDTYKWIVPPNGDVPKVDLVADGFLPERAVTQKSAGEHRRSQEVGALSVYHSDAELAISRTLPAGFGQRHRCLFNLARELKGIDTLAVATLAELKPIVVEWHKQAVGHIQTKPFEESWIDFADAWCRVRYAKGEEPMTMIFEQAIRDIPKVAEQYEQVKVRQLAALCKALQREAGDKPFFLASREAGRLLGVQPMQAWRWLKLLSMDGIVELVRSGSQREHRASEYRYLHQL